MAENIFNKTGATAAPAKAQNETAPVAPVVPPVDDSSETAPLPKMDELTVLKQRARMMNITFSNNIGIDALREKVNAATQGVSQATEETSDDDDADETVEAPVTAPEKPQTIRQRLYAEEMKLVRVRITCLDPKKKDLPGEIITVGNKYLGTIRKFVPFGEFTDNGYHIPHIIYKLLKEREFLSIKTRKTPRGPVVEQSMAREFAIEVLPPLTEAELADLKAAQLSRGDQA